MKTNKMPGWMPNAMRAGILAAAAGLALAPLQQAGAVPLEVAGVGSAEVDGEVGVTSFRVGGVEHMALETFFIRNDSEPLPDSRESGTLDLVLLGGGSTGSASASFSYETLTGLGIQVDYELGGVAGSGSATLTERYTITNLGLDPATFSFFVYTDADLAGEAGGQTASFDGASTITQMNSDGSWQLTFSSSETPGAWEISGFPALILGFLDDAPSTLADGTSPFGPADVSFAYEYRVAGLGLDSAFSFEVTKTIADLRDGEVGVPEPASLLLLSAGGLLLAGLGRKRAA